VSSAGLYGQEQRPIESTIAAWAKLANLDKAKALQQRSKPIGPQLQPLEGGLHLHRHLRQA